MIVYFDTSAVVPLVIEEPSTDLCVRLWNDASRVAASRLLYPEARAALTRAERLRRITKRQHTSAVTELDSILLQLDHIELTAAVAASAGSIAHEYGLRGFDAVHLATAATLADPELVVATGDAELAAAAGRFGLAVVRTST